MTRASLLSFVLLATQMAVFGQQTSGAPVQAKRLPPDKANRKAANDTYLDRYDFGAQVSTLQGSDVLNPPAVAVPSPAPAVPAPDLVPPGFKPKIDVQLTKTAQDAVQISDKWIAEHNQPAVGRDGRVLYSYGAGLPTVVCAPLRVCIVELQAGEKLVGEPHIGDSIRWNLSPAMYGTGASTTSVIVLKPQGPGLDTNLLITTDRRAYYLRLLSKPEDYVARVAFAYPDDDDNEKRWQQHVAEQKDGVPKSVESR